MAAVGFGFSPSDIVAFLKGLYQVYEVCRDSDKASAEHARAIEGSNDLQLALRYWENIQDDNQPVTVQAIQVLAKAIETSEEAFKSRFTKKYGDKLGSRTRKGHLDAFLTKVYWVMQGRSDVKKHDKERQAQGMALNWRTTSINHAQLAQLNDLTKRLFKLMEGMTSEIRQLAPLPAKIDNMGSSMNSTILQSRDDQLAGVKAVNDKVKISIDKQKTFQEDLHCKFGQIRSQLIQGQETQDQTLEIARQVLPANRALGDAVERLLRLLSNSDQPERHSRDTPVGSMNIPASTEDIGSEMRLTWNQGQRGSFIGALQVSIPLRGESQSHRQAALFFALIWLYLEMFREIVRYLAAYLPDRHPNEKISRPFSLLLSDNIRFTDSLGREKSLSLAPFTHWKVLNEWIKAVFKACPGFQKVKAGKFVIFDVTNPERALNSGNWEKSITPRARYKMAIIFDQMQVVRGRCIKCIKTNQVRNLRRNGDVNLTCSSCGLFCSTLGIRSLKSVYNTLSILPEDGDGPHDRDSLFLIWKAKLAHKDLEHRLHPLLGDDEGIEEIDLEGHSLKAGVSLCNEEAEDIYLAETLETGDSPKQDTTSDVEVDPSEKDGVETHGPSPDTSSLKDVEEEEITHFSSIWIEPDTRLHDAALKRDRATVRQLLQSGLEVNAKTGRTGSALVASVIAGFLPTVLDLLEAGADPLLELNGQHTAVSVATCYGNEGIVDCILRAALRLSYEKPARYQEVIDHALYEALSNNCSSRIQVLCFLGANPATELRGRRSSLAHAVSSKDHNVIRTLIANLWNRDFLNASEARRLLQLTHGMDVPSSSPWLEACCRSLSQGSTQMIDRRMKRRLAARQSSRFYFDSILRNPHSDGWTYTFWRRYRMRTLWKLTSEDMDVFGSGSMPYNWTPSRI